MDSRKHIDHGPTLLALDKVSNKITYTSSSSIASGSTTLGLKGLDLKVLRSLGLNSFPFSWNTTRCSSNQHAKVFPFGSW
ncbi:MAG: hypothetical protein K2X94_05175 [Amoebophilaceae bacterium]|nr:hypothetical protein [Amoebophilaceae bacterium]